MLVELLNNTIEKRQVEKPEPGVIYASELGRCSYYLYLRLQGTPFSDKIEEAAFTRFHEGDVHEAEIVERLKQIDENLQTQVPVSCKFESFEIRGKADVVMSYPSPCVVEIKALNSFSARKFSERIDYLLQGAFYAVELELPLIFLVKNRDTGETKEYPFTLKQCKEIYDAHIKTLPSRLQNPSKIPTMEWECRYCRYRSLCQPAQEKKEFINDHEINTMLEEYVELQKQISALEKQKKAILEAVKTFMLRHKLQKYYIDNIHAHLVEREYKTLKKEYKAKLPPEYFETRKSVSVLIKITK